MEVEQLDAAVAVESPHFCRARTAKRAGSIKQHCQLRHSAMSFGRKRRACVHQILPQMALITLDRKLDRKGMWANRSSDIIASSPWRNLMSRKFAHSYC